MSLLQISTYYTKFNFKISFLKQAFSRISSTACLRTNQSLKSNESTNLETLTAKYEFKLFYNSIVEKKKIRFGYKNNKAYIAKVTRNNKKLKDAYASIQPLPISLKYITEESKLIAEEDIECQEEEDEMLVQFPYNINKNDTVLNENEIIDRNKSNTDTKSIKDEIHQRNMAYKGVNDWMTAYDNFENDLMDVESSDRINFGTADPNSHISNTPCGGCGALLHCKNSSIPGFIPSEIFKNSSKKEGVGLQAMICQRCFFLNEYNLALQVNVSPDDYPKILASIRGKQALVLLMVDLMDFPCSIWPGIADILGSKTPIIAVGNKVDLLPKDGKKFLNRVKENLLNHIKLSGFGTSNILHIALISAKTGYGIEDLITALHKFWKHKGDVYLVGCTNVGKSSLFNSLLQSDYCKIQASDLIQRATISNWPGTTLNMLKFPIMRPTGQRLFLRYQRIVQEQQISSRENELKEQLLRTDNSAEYATLMGSVGQTFFKTNKEGKVKDHFSVSNRTNDLKIKIGIDDQHPEYVLSRWCFDTPGVVQPDQILHLLTIEELMYTLPKELIRPETFCVKPKTVLFIAGLARLDYLDGPGSIRLTVFRSNELPITICPLVEADEFYKDCLGTELLKVPMEGTDRLSQWPGLQPTEPFTITGIDSKISSNDVVLSSAGWVAVNCNAGNSFKFQAWTPEKRGIYVRDCLLPHAVTLRGTKIRNSVAYRKHKFI